MTTYPEPDAVRVGDVVRFAIDDCCLAVEGEGVVEAVETYAESIAPEIPDSPGEGEQLVGVKVGGVWIRRDWAWTDEFTIVYESRARSEGTH